MMRGREARDDRTEPQGGVTVDASRRWMDGPDVHDQRKMFAKRMSSNQH